MARMILFVAGILFAWHWLKTNPEVIWDHAATCGYSLDHGRASFTCEIMRKPEPIVTSARKH